MHIRNYALLQQHSPELLVQSVTDLLKTGYQPVGGVAVAVEPAVVEVSTMPAAKSKASKPRIIYAQAMVRLVTPQDALTQVVARVNGS